MSATDDLRRLLDERGVEWANPNSICADITTIWRDGGWEYEAVESSYGDELSLQAEYAEWATPAQAVEIALGKEIDGDTSDGYHSFNELYHHRAVLFSVIVRDHPDHAWKSKLHHDGTMYDGMFIVGIDTPEGQATYHYDIDHYWEMFDCKELERAPEWDGHTSDDAIARIAKLGRDKCRLIGCVCSECGALIGPSASMIMEHRGDDLVISRSQDVNFCPNCGRKVER